MGIKEPEPEGSKIQDQATGWNSNFKSGKGVDTISSGIEGAWTSNPIKWDVGYFDNLFGYDWELTKILLELINGNLKEMVMI